MPWIEPPELAPLYDDHPSKARIHTMAEAHQLAQDNLVNAQQANKANYDKESKVITYNVGAAVYIFYDSELLKEGANKKFTRKWRPGIIVDVIGPQTYLCRPTDKKSARLTTVNARRLKARVQTLQDDIQQDNDLAILPNADCLPETDRAHSEDYADYPSDHAEPAASPTGMQLRNRRLPGGIAAVKKQKKRKKKKQYILKLSLTDNYFAKRQQQTQPNSSSPSTSSSSSRAPSPSPRRRRTPPQRGATITPPSPPLPPPPGPRQREEEHVLEPRATRSRGPVKDLPWVQQKPLEYGQPHDQTILEDSADDDDADSEPEYS